MPSAYAHYRFGREALSRLPRDLSRMLQRFPQLYNMGLQGPDFFFYHNPLMHTATGALASHYHSQSGKEFFENSLRILKGSPSEGARAYLYGVLGHYCLDSVCHPTVKAIAAEGKIGHMELETEFDRFLFEKDGKLPADTQSMARYLKLTRGECVTVAQFYPPAAPGAVNASVRHMAWVDRLATAKNRKLAAALMGVGGEIGRQMVKAQFANENCSHLDEPLLALYTQALETYPVLAAQLTEAMEKGTPLDDAFSPVFG